MSEHKDLLSLRGILDALTRIESYVAGIADADTIYGDQRTFDAVCMNFIVIGEMVKRISSGFKESHDGIDGLKSRHCAIVSHTIISVLMPEKSGRSFTTTFHRYENQSSRSCNKKSAATESQMFPNNSILCPQDARNRHSASHTCNAPPK